MDITPRGLISNWFPHFPTLLKTVILAALGLSENSEHQDFITQVIVQAARPLLQTPTPLLASQKFFTRDFGIWGRMWVSKYTVPIPDYRATSGFASDEALTVEEAIDFAINTLATRPEERECPTGKAQDVEIEWTSFRRHVWHTARSPRKTEREIYDHMMEDLDDESSPTILYCHGGAFCLMDPVNHRWTTSSLAQYCHARVMSVRYRLSPQAVFPAALIDVFISYLTLLSPPPDAYHTAVDPRKIVIAGDSSGAGLATALQLLLHTLILHGKTQIRWHNDSIVTIPATPSAALSLTSAYLDVTRSLPSCTENARWDIIAPPPPLIESTLSTSPLFPADEIWPAKPPRTETYCTAVICAHPLVSPLIAPKSLLKYLPPLYVCVGWEGMMDEGEVFCRRVWEAKVEGTSKNAHESQLASVESTADSVAFVDSNDSFRSLPGTTEVKRLQALNLDFGAYINFDGYIGMPHTFSFIAFNRAGWTEISRRSQHIVEAVALAHGLPSGLKKTTHARWTHSKTLAFELIPIQELGVTSQCSGYPRTEALTEDVLNERVQTGREFRVSLERRLVEQWKFDQGGNA